MKTMNVNGQNGVATSAEMMFNNKFNGLTYHHQAREIMTTIGFWCPAAKQGLLDKVRKMRMNNCSAKEFVYNNIKFKFSWGLLVSTGERVFQIYATKKNTNGRYMYGSNMAFRKFPNYYGISGVFNTLMCDLVSDVLEIADIAKADWHKDVPGIYYVDSNSPDSLEGPDALNNDIESIMEFFGDDYKALNDIENEFLGYRFDIDDDLRDNLLFKRNGTFIDMYYNNMNIINNSVYIRLTDIKNISDFEKALYKLISTLINDNGENDGPDSFDGFENASEECDGDMMACVDKYGQEFIDEVINEYADIVSCAVSEFDLDDTINYCVEDALKDMEYNPDEKKLVGCSLVGDLENWDDKDEFCEYFGDAYDFDWDSCQKFYEKYCNDILHFADEYDDRMEGALKDFDKGAVFDKMPYEINYNEDYINVYIDMDDFVNYIKKNMIFNDSMAQLFKYNDMGINLYNMSPKSEYINEFYDDLKNMLPVVTDVKLYDDGLYLWYDDMKDMTIRNKMNNFLDMYNNMDKWVVIAKCSDGDVVIGKNGQNAFDIDMAGEIAKDHQNMGAEIEIMQYAKYKEIYE